MKKSVKEFRRRYKVDVVDEQILKSIITQQGYTIIGYNGISEREEVQELIDALGVGQYIQSCKCFTYQDSHFRLLFLHEDLSPGEQKIILAHEEGHIWNKHLKEGCIFGDDVLQEYEANEFAHYLLDDKTRKKHRNVAALAIIFIMLLLIVVGLKKRYESSVYTENLYISASGTKYHRKDCIYLRNRTDVTKLTKEEYESGSYEPCEVCFPDAQ